MKNKYFSKPTKYVLLALLPLLFIVSCAKDNFELDKLAQTEWNPNIAAPLVYSSLSIQDILTEKDTNSLIQVGSDKFCTLIYEGNLFTYVASDLIQLPDQNSPPYTASLSAAQAAALAPIGATVTFSNSQTISFNSGSTNAKIDSIKFKDGDFKFVVNSDFQNNGSLSISIPSAKKNGVAFSKTVPISFSGIIPVVVNVSEDLTGYTFDMTKGGTTYNQFDINFSVTLIGNGTAPTTSKTISVTQSIEGMKFQKLFGDIGQQQLSPNKDTVELSVFTNSLTGSFTFDDPRIKVVISNSYGVPIQGNIIQFDAYKPPSSSYPITGYPNPLPVLSPNMSQMGQTKVDSFMLDKNNSNVASVFSNLPSSLIYQVNSTTNPSGPTTSNFVLDTSKFKVDLEVEFPLHGTAIGFTMVDTVPFEFDEAVENIEWILLRTYNNNGFPLEVDLQAYFVDTNYVLLDSLFKIKPVLASGFIDNTGKVIAPKSSSQDCKFYKPQLTKLEKARFIVIHAIANTAKNSNGVQIPVKIYADYKLDVKIGAQVQLSTKF